MKRFFIYFLLDYRDPRLCVANPATSARNNKFLVVDASKRRKLNWF